MHPTAAAWMVIPCAGLSALSYAAGRATPTFDDVGERFALLAERQIYAPHFYNSMQMLAGVIPHEDGTVLFYEGRTYTDQVAGFGGGMKHSVGGKQLAREIRKLLTEIRTGIETDKARGSRP